MRARVIALAAALAAIAGAAAPRASADEPRKERITITTRSQVVITGDAEEVVPGKPVKVVADRKEHVIPWRDITCSSRFGWFREPPPKPGPRSRIRFTTDGTAALLEERWGTSTHPLELYDERRELKGPIVVLECQRSEWRPLCTGDCTIDVAANQRLRVAGPTLEPVDWLTFEPGEGQVQVRARTPSRARQLLGVALTMVGVSSITITSLVRGLTSLSPNETVGGLRDTMHYALFWSGAGLIAAGAPLLSMEASPVRVTRDGDRAGWMHGELRGLEVGVRVAEGFRYQGKNPSPTRDVKPDDGIRRFTAAQIDLGYRVLPELYAGVFGEHGIADVRCAEGRSCFGRVSRAGATVRGIWLSPTGRFSFWGGVGAAYEWTSSRTAQPLGVDRVAYRGPQLFFAEAGFDVAPARKLFLGPFTRASFGHYDAVSAQTASEGDRSGPVRHAAALMWFDLGLRGAFTL